MFPPSLPENFNAQEWKGIFVQALENVSFWNNNIIFTVFILYIKSSEFTVYGYLYFIMM